MFKKNNKLISFFALLYLTALCFFIWGLLAGHFKVFPWPQITVAYNEFHAFFTFEDGPDKSTSEKFILDHQESKSKYSFSGLKRKDEEFHDNGYLLISAYSKKHKQVIVELFSIRNNKVVHTWIPPISEILKLTPRFQTGTNTLKTYRVQHPLLLDDGGLVFTSGEGPMVRINVCSDIVWILEHHFHHSIELDHLGNIVTCSKLNDNDNKLVFPSRDDGIAIVSMEGKLLKEYSITNLLLNNGYDGLIYGVGRFEKDRIHLNDAQPILKETSEAKLGDVLVSIRHLSTVALLSPYYNSIKWLKTGPWLNQHDINPLSDGRYSIFGNDIVRGNKGEGNRLVNKGKSEIYIYDSHKDTVFTPYASVMKNEKIASPTEGRSKILPNGDVFIEQTNTSRLLRISENEVRWEYVYGISDETVGALHWSRYLSNSDVDLGSMKNLTCD